MDSGKLGFDEVIEAARVAGLFDGKTLILKHVIGVLGQVYGNQHLIGNFCGSRKLADFHIALLLQQKFILDITENQYTPAFRVSERLNFCRMEFHHVIGSD